MKTILKPIFELITGDFALFGNVIYNYIAMGIIGLIAFAVAWRVVGFLYDTDMIDGRGIGSLIHWIIRLIVFVVIFYLFSFVIWLVKFIISVQWWTWLITAIFVAASIIIVIWLKKKRNEANEN